MPEINSLKNIDEDSSSSTKITYPIIANELIKDINLENLNVITEAYRSPIKYCNIKQMQSKKNYKILNENKLEISKVIDSNGILKTEILNNDYIPNNVQVFLTGTKPSELSHLEQIKTVCDEIKKLRKRLLDTKDATIEDIDTFKNDLLDNEIISNYLNNPIHLIYLKLNQEWRTFRPEFFPKLMKNLPSDLREQLNFLRQFLATVGQTPYAGQMDIAAPFLPNSIGVKKEFLEILSKKNVGKIKNKKLLVLNTPIGMDYYISQDICGKIFVANNRYDLNNKNSNKKYNENDIKNNLINFIESTTNTPDTEFILHSPMFLINSHEEKIEGHAIYMALNVQNGKIKQIIYNNTNSTEPLAEFVNYLYPILKIFEEKNVLEDDLSKNFHNLYVNIREFIQYSKTDPTLERKTNWNDLINAYNKLYKENIVNMNCKLQDNKYSFSTGNCAQLSKMIHDKMDNFFKSKKPFNKLNKSKTLNQYTIENHNSLQQTVVSPQLLKGKIGLPNEINNSEIVRQNGSCASSETDRICKDIRRQSLIQSLRFSRQMSSLNNSHNINKEK